MSLRFEQPLWLWLLALAIPLAIVGYRWFAAMSSPRKASAVIFRAVLLALLASALGGLSMVRRTDTLAVVAILDVSESVRRFGKQLSPDGLPLDAIERARAYLSRATRSRGAEDLMGIVAFDGQAITIATPTRGNVLDRPLDPRVADGTNIADAIRLARTLIPSDAAGRLLLVSDGNQTAGSVMEATDETAGYARAGAARRGLPIDVITISYNITDEVIVESIDAPATAPTEATVSLRVVLNATVPSNGTLRLLREGQPINFESGPDPLGRRLSLKPGRTVEVIEIPLNAAKVHRFRAVYEPDPIATVGGGQALSGDTLTQNNSAEAVTITPGKGSVLLVDGVAGGKGSTLETTLRESGIDVTAVPPENAPADLLALQAYDLVILENVAADRVPAAFHDSVVAYVRELGGGLVTIGGPDSFGAGGWRGTPVEAILPVRLDLPERVVAPEVATVFVMDNSGSMNWAALGSGRSKQDLATQAAALAISRLEKNDYVGLIVFNNAAEEVIPLALNTDPEGNARKVLEVSAGGGTNMVPAMSMALRQLSAINVKQKHVIILSDGRSMGREVLADRAGELANAGIKVSTIAVGLDADGDMMEQMAKRGGGEFYRVINPSTLPRIFLKAVRLVRSPLFREAPFEPLATGSVSPLLTGLGTLPRLNGLNLTQARPEPTITTPLASPNAEPVLAHWNVELGRVAAFTSDASHWATPWIATPTYRQFWLQVVRQMARPATGRAFQGATQMRGERLRVTVNAVANDGTPMDLIEMPATVYLPGGGTLPLALSQVAPGVYEGEVAAMECGTYVTVVRPSQSGSTGKNPLTPVILGASSQEGPELRTLRSNDEAMRAIAAATGGRVLDLSSAAPANLFVRDGVSPQEAATAVWRTLLAWAIAMLLLDIATRRVAWDRWVSREFGAEVVGAAREAVRDRGKQAAGALSGLRDARDSTEAKVQGPSMALGEQEAADLVAGARDRRRAARLSEIRAAANATSSTSPEPTLPHKEEGESPGLAAAKRRAARLFEKEE